MFDRPGFRLRVQPGGLRAALANSVGLTLLVLSVLPWVVLVAASLAKVPGLSIWQERVAWLPLIGLIAYLATVIASLLLPPDLPDDAGLRELLRIQQDMRDRYRELQSDTEHVGRGALISELAESVRRMDLQVVPTFGQIVIKRNRLNQHLARYDKERFPCPTQSCWPSCVSGTSIGRLSLTLAGNRRPTRTPCSSGCWTARRMGLG